MALPLGRQGSYASYVLHRDRFPFLSTVPFMGLDLRTAMGPIPGFCPITNLVLIDTELVFRLLRLKPSGIRVKDLRSDRGKHRLALRGLLDVGDS